MVHTRNNDILVKISKIISKTKIDPNIVTLSAIIFAAISAYYIIQIKYLYAIFFMALSGIVDIIDGNIARVQNKVTPFGNYLDAMVDKYVEIIIYSGFALAGYAVPAFFAITGSLIISYAKPRLAIVIPADNHDWPAIGERADRFTILIAGLVLSMIYPAIYGYDAISVTLWTVALITNVGAIQRIKYANNLIKTHLSKR
ncbi:MAG: CDP-alcohol phosphatidyltransferase family protein [Nanoarchaeota archaeon]